MYSKLGYSVAGAGGIGGSTALATAGLNTLATVVAGSTVLFAVLALAKLIPRRAK